MYRSDPKKALRSVRMFPRLAVTNSTSQTSRRRARMAAIRASTATEVDPAATARAEVKARLLRMILDNEQVRRHGQRPNQV